MSKEALKLALEALERSVSTCFTQYSHEQVMSRPEHFINQTITALKEALAQPEQEPFCYHDGRNIVGKEYADHSDVFPLYTSPPIEAAHGIKE